MTSYGSHCRTAASRRRCSRRASTRACARGPGRARTCWSASLCVCTSVGRDVQDVFRSIPTQERNEQADDVEPKLGKTHLGRKGRHDEERRIAPPAHARRAVVVGARADGRGVDRGKRGGFAEGPVELRGLRAPAYGRWCVCAGMEGEMEGVRSVGGENRERGEKAHHRRTRKCVRAARRGRRRRKSSE